MCAGFRRPAAGRQQAAPDGPRRRRARPSCSSPSAAMWTPSRPTPFPPPSGPAWARARGGGPWARSPACSRQQGRGGFKRGASTDQARGAGRRRVRLHGAAASRLLRRGDAAGQSALTGDGLSLNCPGSRPAPAELPRGCCSALRCRWFALRALGSFGFLGVFRGLCWVGLGFQGLLEGVQVTQRVMMSVGGLLGVSTRTLESLGVFQGF